MKKFDVTGNNKLNDVWGACMKPFLDADCYFNIEWLAYKDIVAKFGKNKDATLSPIKQESHDINYVFDTNTKQNILILLSK